MLTFFSTTPEPKFGCRHIWSTGREEKHAMVEDWRDLRVGDRIRIVRLPSAAAIEGYVFHADTRRLYKRLIARKRPLTIYQIDEMQLPWSSAGSA